MRITASWSGSLARRIQGCGTIFSCTYPQLPSDVVIPTTQVCRVVLGTLKDKGPLRAALCAILDRSCARRRSARVGRDEETGAQVEQRNWRSK